MYSSGNIDVRNWVHLFESRYTLYSERRIAVEEYGMMRLLRKILCLKKEKKTVWKSACWWASWQRIRLAEHVTRTEETRNVYVVMVGRETAWKTKDTLEYNKCVCVCVCNAVKQNKVPEMKNCRIILKWSLNRIRGCVLEASGSRWEPLMVCYEHGNESSGPIGCWKLKSHRKNHQPSQRATGNEKRM